MSDYAPLMVLYQKSSIFSEKKCFCCKIQNAFPVSGQLYTTHLLSLEALLTVIDSTQAHCQDKVVSSTAQQDQSETLLAEGEGSTKNGTNTLAGKHNQLSLYGHLSVRTFKTYCLDSVVFTCVTICYLIQVQNMMWWYTKINKVCFLV